MILQKKKSDRKEEKGKERKCRREKELMHIKRMRFLRNKEIDLEHMGWTGGKCLFS